MILRRLFRSKARREVEPPTFGEGDIDGFWRWYHKHSEIFRTAILDAKKGIPMQKELVIEIGTAVRQYNRELAFEIGIDGFGDLELVISADGIVAEFPSVIRLVEAAPLSPGHRATAFRQRSGDTVLKIAGQSVSPSDVGFNVRQSAKYDGLDLVLDLPMPVDSEERDRARFGFLLLDGVLGEYDVATTLSNFEFKARGIDVARVGRPLPELAAVVDEFNANREKQ